MDNQALGVLYRPPKANVNNAVQLLDPLLSNFSVMYDHVVVLGDKKDLINLGYYHKTYRIYLINIKNTSRKHCKKIMAKLYSFT
nr:unnamed protein product [Callosobruchus chinensis]